MRDGLIASINEYKKLGQCPSFLFCQLVLAEGTEEATEHCAQEGAKHHARCCEVQNLTHVETVAANHVNEDDKQSEEDATHQASEQTCDCAGKHPRKHFLKRILQSVCPRRDVFAWQT